MMTTMMVKTWKILILMHTYCNWTWEIATKIRLQLVCWLQVSRNGKTCLVFRVFMCISDYTTRITTTTSTTTAAAAAATPVSSIISPTTTSAASSSQLGLPLCFIWLEMVYTTVWYGELVMKLICRLNLQPLVVFFSKLLLDFTFLLLYFAQCFVRACPRLQSLLSHIACSVCVAFAVSILMRRLTLWLSLECTVGQT